MQISHSRIHSTGSPFRHRLLTILLLSLCTACSLPATAKHAIHPQTAEKPTESEELTHYADRQDVDAFIEAMASKYGFSRPDLEALFQETHYIPSAVQLIKPAPVTQPKNWQAYRARFVEPVRIAAGVAFWDSYADALAREEKDYGVPAEIIVGILGVETLFGRHTGNFRVMDVLATLAFAYPDTPTRTARMEYFKSELENTLLFARESAIDPFSLHGSYAGAIGWPQFMPASIRKYAVDYDGDGKIDLRNSPVDAIGSVGNFLVQHGWKRGEPIVFPATVIPAEEGKAPSWQALIGQSLAATTRLEELKAAGVHPNIDPPNDMLYGLVDLQNGTEPTEYWLGANNFFTITQYNRSYFYAMSVVDLGREVRMMRDAGK